MKKQQRIILFSLFMGLFICFMAIFIMNMDKSYVISGNQDMIMIDNEEWIKIKEEMATPMARKPADSAVVAAIVSDRLESRCDLLIKENRAQKSEIQKLNLLITGLNRLSDSLSSENTEVRNSRELLKAKSEYLESELFKKESSLTSQQSITLSSFNQFQSKLDSITDESRRKSTEMQKMEIHSLKTEMELRKEIKESTILDYEEVGFSRLFSALSMGQFFLLFGGLITLFLGGYRLGSFVKNLMFDKEKIELFYENKRMDDELIDLKDRLRQLQKKTSLDNDIEKDT